MNSHPLGTATRPAGACAARALLDCLDVQASARALSEGAGDGSELERAAHLLCEVGYPARIVQATLDAALELPVPTLARARDGESLLLLEKRGRRWLVEHGGAGRRLVSRAQLDALWGGLVIERQERRGTATRLVPLLREQLSGFGGEQWLLVALATLAAVLTFLPSWLTRKVMDVALPQRGPGLLGALALAIVFVSVQRAWLSHLRLALVRRAETRVSRAVLNTLFKQLTEARYDTLARRPLGSSLQALGSAEAAATTACGMLIGPVFELLSSVAAVVVLSLTAPALTAMLLCVLAPALGLGLWLAWRRAARHEREVEATAEQRAALHEVLSGAATIKSLGAEKPAVARWLVRLVDERGLQLERGRLALARDSVLDGAHKIVAFLAFTLAGHACLEGTSSVGTFLMVTSMADIMARSMRNVARLADPLLQLAAHARRVDATLAEDMPTTPARAAAGGRDPHAIVLEDVWFRYGPGEPWILRGHNLRIVRGERVRLHGASGSGKTTILRLIAGLYTPERGSVSVFGRDPAAMRERLTYVPQQAYLFEGSILHNLEVLSGVGRERVLSAARRTGLADWIASLPMGFETVLLPGAHNISGGERQWIVLTAALAAGREIVLLDESLSQIDGLLRARLGPKRLWDQCTVLQVAHEAELGMDPTPHQQAIHRMDDFGAARTSRGVPLQREH